MLPKQFTLTKKLYEEYKEIYQLASPIEQAVDEYLKNHSTGNWWHYDLGQSFEKEYHYHIKEDLYFAGCRFAKYDSSYDERKKEFLEHSIDALEIDFIVKELNELSKVGFEYCNEELKRTIQYSVRRQIDFLTERSKSTDFIIEKHKDKWGYDKYGYRKDLSNLNENYFADLSDSTLSEKIVCLHYLGALEYFQSLNHNGFSKNGLASLLSLITGANRDTIQSAINPINNKSVSQKNNPLKNKKTVSKVKKTLLNLGYLSSE